MSPQKSKNIPISTKLITLLILSALLPMILFGILSIWTSRQTTYTSLSEGNLNVAKRAADQIALYVTHSLSILEALSQHLSKTDLQEWQKERVIKNHVIHFEQFHQIFLTDQTGREVITSRLGGEGSDHSQEAPFQRAMKGETSVSEVFISDNLAPSITLALPLTGLNRINGALIAEVNLIDMWRLVDSIRIGERGYAFVVSKGGLLIAHGAPEAKGKVLRQEEMTHLAIVRSVLKDRSETQVYQDSNGKEYLGVSAPIPSLGWGVIIEQPTEEAYAPARKMTFHLTALVLAFLLLMIIIGYLGGRWQVVAPIRELINSTRAISTGNLDEKVRISTGDEFQELGEAFNRMTERLKELQEDIRRNERSVTFGRIAAGLVHDLRHPIRNIENSSRLLPRMSNNPASQETFTKTVEREFGKINRFLDDLYNLTHPTPLAPIPLKAHTTLSECLEPFQEEITQRGIRLVLKFHPDPLEIWADRFAVGRVFTNIIHNAIEAMPEGGQLTVSTGKEKDAQKRQDFVRITFSDTGSGIPPERLSTLFTDYTTTKRKGLGLGLAISKKIVEELQGSISVESTVGRGTTVTLCFPSPPA